jgi:hypothetical protein
MYILYALHCVPLRIVDILASTFQSSQLTYYI